MPHRLSVAAVSSIDRTTAYSAPWAIEAVANSFWFFDRRPVEVLTSRK